MTTGMSISEVLVEPHSCPIAKVHRRLEQAHQLWHEAEAYYFDPRLFPTYFNSAIQALRSVTWILQKHKHSIPDFDAWYGPWQDRMRADPVMRWLVQARNRIEKEGDLDGKSSAIVRVIDSYLEAPSSEITVKAWLTSDEIAEKLYELMGPPPPEIKDASLVVERRWVENDLPDHEVLDALAHCYGVLSELVSDAHRILGLPEMKLLAESGEVGEPIPFHGGRLPCMVATERGRTTTIHAESGAVSKTYSKRVSVDSSVEEKGLERYGETFSEATSAVRAARTMREHADALFEMAKQMLVKDRYHNMVVLLFRDEKVEKVMELRPSDRAAKYLLWRDVAKEVEVKGATAVITIAEAWQGRFDPANPYRQAVDDPERSEVLELFAESMDGEIVALAYPFSRGASGEILLGEIERTEGVEAGFMLPVKEVWKKWKESPPRP